MPLKNKHLIKSFNELSIEPVVVDTYYWRNREYKKYNLSLIAGTVVDKNKTKSMITIATQFGEVVDVKIDKGKFSYYDRTSEKTTSWLSRGNKLMILGYRSGSVFYPKVYKDSIYPHSIMKIDDDKLSKGEIFIISNKESVDL